MRRQLLALAVPFATALSMFASVVPAQAAGACNGGLRYVSSGSTPVTFHDCTFSGLTLAGKGGAIMNSGTLTLTNVTITGNTATGDGSSTGGQGGGIWNEGTLTLNNVTINGNKVTGGDGDLGGGLWNDGEVFLNSVNFLGNHSDGFGGAIWNDSTLHVNGVTIGGTGSGSGNDAHFDGGGLYDDGGAIDGANLTVQGNSGVNGAGVYTDASAVDLRAVTVSGNTATGNGGGIWNDSISTFTQSSFSGNTAVDGAGIYNEEQVRLVQSTVRDNTASQDGGGIIDLGNNAEGNPALSGTCSQNLSDLSRLSMDRVTVSGNHAVNGAGIDEVCSLITGAGLVQPAPAVAGVQRQSRRARPAEADANSPAAALPRTVLPVPAPNVTLAGNIATGNGGGLRMAANGTASFLNPTIADNRAAKGAGVWVEPPAFLLLQASLFARNQGAGGLDNCHDEGTGNIGETGGANSANIETGNSCGFTNPSDKTNVADPGLATALGDNFGFVKTLALQRGSVAIDAVPGGCPPPPVDARDMTRPQATNCDSGAYECIGGAPAVSQVSPTNGPPAGGTQVTITGTNFDRPAKVFFGTTAAASVVINSATSITATTPPGTAGAHVNIQVQTCRADSPTGGANAAFTFNAPPPALPKAGAGHATTPPAGSVALVVLMGLGGIMLAALVLTGKPRQD